MSKRSRWKLLVALAVLVVGVVGFRLFVSKVRERKEFVSQVDPYSGCRCRFTLSSAWEHDKTMSDKLSALTITHDYFTLQPSPIERWVHRYLKHNQGIYSPPIFLSSSAGKRVQSNFRLVDGYPEPFSSEGEQTVTKRHFRIDTYPATLITGNANSKHGAVLMVYVPGRAIFYELSSGADTPYNAQADAEVQAIASSFHVEKVTVGSR